MVRIDPFAQLFARFKMRHMFTLQGNRSARFGISTHSGRSKMKAETAKPPNFDALSAGERLAHFFDETFYRQFDIFVGKMPLMPGQ